MARAAKVGGILRRLWRLLPASYRHWLRKHLNSFICRLGYVPFDAGRFYAEDGLFSVHNDEFRRDPAFVAAYQRGVQSSHGIDPALRWRIHIALWAARLALKAPGDYVECGVNAGMVSSAILHDLNWSALPRQYFLIDTFAGPVLDQFSAEERQSGWVALVEERVAAGAYVTDIDRVRATFAEWPNAIVVQGTVPEILPSIGPRQIAFLHLDLNCAAPEVAALEYFWSQMAPGAVVLMDDYAHHGVEEQKKAIDRWADRIQVEVLSLPTGQGLIVK